MDYHNFKILLAQRLEQLFKGKKSPAWRDEMSPRQREVYDSWRKMEDKWHQKVAVELEQRIHDLEQRVKQLEDNK